MTKIKYNQNKRQSKWKMFGWHKCQNIKVIGYILQNIDSIIRKILLSEDKGASYPRFARFFTSLLFAVVLKKVNYIGAKFFSSGGLVEVRLCVNFTGVVLGGGVLHIANITLHQPMIG